jgi:hypothetical protein
MLDPKLVESIRKLLASGATQRSVQRITGVSRGRIIVIAKGEYPDYQAMRHLRRQKAFDRTQPAQKCATCGNRVYMPCMICRTRNAQASGSPSLGIPDRHSPKSLQLELHGKHRRRYERLRGRNAWPRNSSPKGPFPNAASDSGANVEQPPDAEPPKDDRDE